MKIRITEIKSEDAYYHKRQIIKKEIIEVDRWKIHKWRLKKLEGWSRMETIEPCYTFHAVKYKIVKETPKRKI